MRQSRARRAPPYTPTAARGALCPAGGSPSHSRRGAGPRGGGGWPALAAASPRGARPLGEGVASAGSSAPLPRPRLGARSTQVRPRPGRLGTKGNSAGLLRNRPRKGPPGRSWGGELLGQTWGIFPEVGPRGHPHFSIRVQEGGARRMDWVTTSDDLVSEGGGGVRWRLGPEQRGTKLHSSQTQLRKWPMPSRCRQCGISGGVLRVTTHPWPPQCRPSCALAGPSRPPSYGYRIPEHSLHSTLDPAGTPPPGVLRGSPRSRPRGSIGWLATRGRSARASAPSPAPATQDAASAKRPRGSGPRPDSAPGQLGRRRRTWPFRSRLPRHSRVGGGKKSEPCFPGPRCSAPNPTPAPPPSPNTPSGARLTLGLPRGRKGGRALGWGKVGVAATLRLTTTSVSAGRFLFNSWVWCSSSWLEKRKKEICPVCGPCWVRGAQQGHPRAKCRGRS